MEALILGTLVILVVLVAGSIVFAVLKGRSGGLSSQVKASVKDELLAFQTGLRQELDTARTSVEGAKDLMSDHAFKTVSQINTLGGTIQKLIQQQEEAERLGQSLKDLLQAPKLRGSYGEAILEELLDRVLPRGIWERQYAIDGGERVDCVVKIKDVVIPIDAKFPRDDYMRYMEAELPEEKTRSWKAFDDAVRKQAAAIQAKYVKPEKGTSEFALMFIPSEAIYYETIASTNQLGQPSAILAHCQDRHVIPVSPNTFYAFLQMVVIGLRNAEVVKSAKKLQEGLLSLRRSFELFYNKYEEMGRRVNQAAEAYRVSDGHIGRYKRRLDETLELDILQQESMEGLPEGSEAAASLAEP